MLSTLPKDIQYIIYRKVHEMNIQEVLNLLIDSTQEVKIHLDKRVFTHHDCSTDIQVMPFDNGHIFDECMCSYMKYKKRGDWYIEPYGKLIATHILSDNDS